MARHPTPVLTSLAGVVTRRWLAAIVFVGLLAATPDVVAATANDARVGILGGEDHRVPVTAVGWPWSSIGRVNRLGGGFCTGTLIETARVLTAAHCLYDQRLARWASPTEINFLAGYNRGDYLVHAVAQRIVRDGRYQPASTAPDNLALDWAVLVLRGDVALRPVVPGSIAAGLPRALEHATLVRAGYGQDRAHALSMHRGCTIDEVTEDLLIHTCDSAHGDSGSPLLLFAGDTPTIVGIHVAIISVRVGPNGEAARRGAAVPAATFAAAATR